jgi:hypothetical protein
MSKLLSVYLSLFEIHPENKFMKSYGEVLLTTGLISIGKKITYYNVKTTSKLACNNFLDLKQ